MSGVLPIKSGQVSLRIKASILYFAIPEIAKQVGYDFWQK